MTSTTVIHQGRSYQVILDPAKRNAPLFSYAQVYRIRQDGTRGRQITTISIAHTLVQAAEALNEFQPPRFGYLAAPIGVR